MPELLFFYSGWSSVEMQRLRWWCCAGGPWRCSGREAGGRVLTDAASSLCHFFNVRATMVPPVGIWRQHIFVGSVWKAPVFLAANPGIALWRKTWTFPPRHQPQRWSWTLRRKTLGNTCNQGFQCGTIFSNYEKWNHFIFEREHPGFYHMIW